ncbi:helix-turn-helix domain-containing protein [Streptomyces goshikiensis]
MSADTESPWTPARFLGQEVLRLREQRGWSQAKLAGKAHMAVSRIGQIENASIPATLDNARDLDAAFETDGILERLMVLVLNPPVVPDWLAEFLDRETKAVSLSEYAPMHVPGLLQTEEYARAVLSTGLIRNPRNDVSAQVAMRMQRQKILRRRNPPALWFVLEQSLLRRPVGGPLVMAKQLEHLAAMADDPAVHLQIIPEAIGAHPALGGTLIMLAMPDGPNLAYLEGGSIGQLFDDPATVARYGLVYDHLQAHALTPSESVAIIRLAQEDMIKMSKTHPQQPDVIGADWTKSTRSNNEGACVEWAPKWAAANGIVPVRDSKTADGPVLRLSPAAWAGLVDLARADG